MSINVLQLHERGWLAAALDGEGTLSFFNAGYGHGRIMTIQIYNTDRRFIHRAKKMIGAGHIYARPPQPHKKQVYEYCLRGSAKVLSLLKQILPYLVIKRTKAQIIIREAKQHPFGRWADDIDERRAKQSTRLKELMRDPEQRKSRRLGMLKWLSKSENYRWLCAKNKRIAAIPELKAKRLEWLQSPEARRKRAASLSLFHQQRGVS